FYGPFIFTWLYRGMFDPGLLKAARVLADLSQKALAEEAGIGSATLVEMEAGRSRPQPETVLAVMSALERHGVQIRDGAVRRLSDRIRFIEGDDCYLKLLEDVGTSLAGKPKAELLIFFGDDAKSPPDVVKAYRKLRLAGIRMRQLVEQGNDFLMGETHEYRYAPKDYFLNRVCTVYGDKIAMVTKTDVKRIIVINDAELAEMQRNLFMWLWSISPQPSETHATERF
ncbi:MAG: hypothetical protein DI551_10405, partial [Micavibrio aeruginosavorus]